MNQLAFDGNTFSAELDGARLSGLLFRVFSALSSGRWMTLQELQEKAGGSLCGVSARVRDLRKPKFGGYVIERRRRGNPKSGLHEYRMET